ncbi:hypothetical protein H9X85_02735 [Anaerotignum lactatifermentans]|uniref:SGNH hydrolase-type esterase domain-containing protein n=1 Tax=Anaerotignum lactatifermentans TaxID=160404 RepID=A0ABS2G9W5_9FIRM|nr:GDSL-type esterase/lipase family protein [Anaerotignum lactatifermentans]MBM6828550.1 hypothetical protein [Anaerotignum lactatifermentans]MBM6877957.1 hypothetical protein [Anaerotignum lactatifermentans]MBM6950132.1 hypothetical protein [Anaerotignum lactatifermentans]
MKKIGYPLLVVLLITFVAAEGFGIWTRVQGHTAAGANGPQPSVTYACLALKEEIQNRGKAPVSDELEIFVGKSQPVDRSDDPLPFVSVDRSYFDDALFIGDSRMVGLSEYSGLDNATYYAEVGLTIYSLFDDPIVPLADGSMGTLDQGLKEKQFGKIYLMVGINELGTGTRERFLQTYTEAVNRIRAMQPDAIIFVQGILYVTQERSDSDAYINNPNIKVRNEDISTLADGWNIFYLDVNDLYSDGNGNLSKEYTFDNAHLKAACYGAWTDFLLSHGIERETIS